MPALVLRAPFLRPTPPRSACQRPLLLAAMRTPAALVLALLVAAPVLQARPAPGDLAAIQRVIRHQLSAFQHDDAALAFSFASPGIQARFGTAQTFLRMVIAGYPAVYRPREVRFLDVQEMDGTPVQLVYLIGPDGQPYRALYSMVQLEDGTWRIDGCALIPVDAKPA